MASKQQPALEYLTTTKIGEKGQLTVPKQFRDDTGLEIGAPVAVLRLGDGLILLPEQRRFEQLCERISAALTEAGKSPQDVLDSLPQVRQLLYERRYGKKAARRATPPTSRRARGK
jgi:AbrB family looped-hinge helix DNA binding protein